MTISPSDEYHAKKGEKVPLELVDPDFIEGLAWALAHGDQKHADTHWKEGVYYDDVIAAIERHVAAIKRGERFDEDSGLSHNYLAAAGHMFLAFYDRNKKKYSKFDNRRWKDGNIRRQRSDSPSGSMGGQSIPGENSRRYPGQAVRGGRGTLQDP